MTCSVGEGTSQSYSGLAMANQMRSRGGSPLSVGCVSPAPRHDGRACESESVAVGPSVCDRLGRPDESQCSAGTMVEDSTEGRGRSGETSDPARVGAEGRGSGEGEDSIVSRRRNGSFARGRGFVDFGTSEELEGVLVGSSPFELGDKAREGLESAFALRQPVLIRGGCGAAEERGLVESWTRYVEIDGRRHFTINPVKSDAGPGEETPHARSGLSLRQIWHGRCRLETQLGKGSDGSPVHEWLSSRDGALVSAACGLEAELSSLGRLMCDGGDSVLRPSFVLGSVYARGGGPTHYDTYHSWAMVLVGRKSFYVLPHETLRKSKGDKPHERSDVDPSHRDLPWRRFDLEPGDVFFLPAGWWHFVVSDPQTIMTNTWVYPRGGDSISGKRPSRGAARKRPIAE
jgi:hypothetical protein